MAAKKQKECEKRFRENASDDSLTSTPTLKQPKISEFMGNMNCEEGPMNDINSDDDNVNDNNDSVSQPSLLEIMREIRSLEKKFKAMIGDEIQSIKENISILDTEFKTMRAEVDSLNRTTKELSKKNNELEQYTRRNNIRIFGIEDPGDWETAYESEKKVLKVIKINLKLIDISGDHIEACHRIGRYKEGKRRAIIIRFCSRKIKEKVIRERRLLKGTNLLICEDLTKENTERFFSVKAATRTMSNITSVWTHNGDTYVYGPAGKLKIPADIHIDDLPNFLKNRPSSSTTAPAKPTRPTTPVTKQRNKK